MNNEELLKNAIAEGMKSLGVPVALEEITIDHSKDPAHDFGVKDGRVR